MRNIIAKNTEQMFIFMISDKRVRILMAAEALINKSGLEAVSIHRVAKQAKVATGTIYLYFKDKDELMAELHERNLRLFAEAFLADVNTAQSLQECHSRLWLNALHYHQENVNVQRLWVHLETLPKNARHKALIQELFKPVKLFLAVVSNKAALNLYQAKCYTPWPLAKYSKFVAFLNFEKRILQSKTWMPRF